MKKHYPMTRRPAGRGYPVQTFRQPNINIPASIIPKDSRGKNLAAQVTTKIHLENSRGEKMTIYQNQQLLHLLRDTNCCFSITEGNHHSHKGGRRK